MNKYYVYELYDELGSIRYVGCSSNPERRLYQHTKVEPNDSVTGFGKFYGWEMDMEIVGEFNDRKEALLFEGERKKYWGMEWTEQTHSIKNFTLIGKRNKESGHIQKISKLGGQKTKELYSKPVLVYTTSGQFVAEYSSQIETSRQMDINVGGINQVINGKLKTYKGYIFKRK